VLDEGREMVVFDDEMIKLLNVPLDAWTIIGISALASRLGRPLIMDAVTANICHNGKSIMGYAILLAKVDANKELLETIEVVY
ncbi:hypothetical protein Tco_0505602, partial [Tanacetum coccineum]